MQEALFRCARALVRVAPGAMPRAAATSLPAARSSGKAAARALSSSTSLRESLNVYHVKKQLQGPLEELRKRAEKNEEEEYEEEEEEEEEEVDEEEDDAGPRQPKIDPDGRAHGLGRRKTSVAQVWVAPGKGQFLVNGTRMFEYWNRDELQNQVLLPLAATGNLLAFDVTCRVSGGGSSGQAGAVRLGLARALDNYNPLWKPALRANGLMTRDPRKVERKKAGRKKARKSKQWVKR